MCRCCPLVAARQAAQHSKEELLALWAVNTGPVSQARRALPAGQSCGHFTGRPHSYRSSGLPESEEEEAQAATGGVSNGTPLRLGRGKG